MDILKALKIFQIEDIGSVDEKAVKKIYRAFMRKNHTDIGGDKDKVVQMNLAYEAIKNGLEQIKTYQAINNTNKTSITWMIQLDKLANIYSGEQLEMTDSKDKVYLHRRNLRSSSVILLIAANIQYKGNIFEFDSMCVTNMRDEYTLECKIVDNEMEEENVRIRAYDKEVNTVIKGPKLNIRLSFDNLVTLIIQLERVERSGQ